MFTRTAVAWRIQLETPIIIVQARMSSSRLPGKGMKTVAGQPMLGYLLDRLEKIENKQRVVVATSEDNSDDGYGGVTSVQTPHNALNYAEVKECTKKIIKWRQL